MRKEVVIMLAEDIPSRNKGEAAIFFGMLESFKSFDNYLFINTTRHEEDMVAYGGPMCNIIRSVFTSKRIIPFAINAVLLLVYGVIARFRNIDYAEWKVKVEPLRSFLNADIIMIGHDNYLASCGLHSFGSTFPIIVFAKLARKKTVAYGCSVGPFETPADIEVAEAWANHVKTRLSLFNRIIICLFKRLILNNIDLITTRDRQSKEYLANQRIWKPRVEYTADLAFLLKPSPLKDVQAFLASKGIEASDAMIGLTGCRWLACPMKKVDGEYLEEFQERYFRYCSIMAEIADMMISEFDVVFLLIAHVIGPDPFHDDRTVNNDICRNIKHKDKVYKIDEDLSAMMLKGIIGNLDLLIGARTHSLIAAASQGVPVVALSNKNRFKTNGIVGEQLSQAKYLIMVENICRRELFSKVKEAWLNREGIGKELSQRMVEVSAMATRNGELLREIFES